ncbi:GAF domain-containing protein [Pseudanabaena galeata UHCC 0370]|uniref:GAF domain-containing protein n=1 Tax=Pseudanabaena galeata UHCC 0370 TaxID=3110310 RepID=A0ABU5TNU7_9CYAN|nr:GAF domain-containing protein [Pseudanabaena galeata]MEA5479835.1 GAF domain-containing protein [Pseudanabaena galeata UHCC 0370]
MSQAGANPWDRQFVNLGRIMQFLRDEDSIDNLLTATLDYLRDNFEYKLLWIGLYDAENHRLTGKGGTTPAGEIKFLKERFNLNAGDLLDQVILQRKPVPIADLRQEKRSGEWQKLAQKFDIQGTLLWPIYHRDRSFGVVLLGSNLWNVTPRNEERARLSVVLGSLGSTLSRLNDEWHHHNTKRPDEPLLQILSKIRNVPALNERLEEIVQETHSFVMPDHTSIYWFEREHQYFWRRVANRQPGPKSKQAVDNTAGVTVQNAPTLYQALSKDQVVVVVDAKSMTKGEVSNRVMEQFGAVSIIIAPIFFQSELLGFLSVEGDEPRLWTDDERNFVRGAAQLAAITAPLEEMEVTLDRIASDQILTAGIARAIYSDNDWQSALDQAAEQLCQRLGLERFWVATYDKDNDVFKIDFQYHPKNRRPLPTLLPGLAPVDVQMMEQSPDAATVENLDSDFKFLSWRTPLLDLDVRSMIVSSTSMGKSLEGILAVAHEAPRTWSRPEREMVQAVAQQIGLIVHQNELQRLSDERQKSHQAVQFGLVALQQCNALEKLHHTATQLMAQVTQSPLAVLVVWLPGRQGGQIASVFASRDEYQLTISETLLAIEEDPLAQWAIQSEGILPLSIHDLPEQTKAWLNAPALGHLMVTALRTTPDHQPTGMILVADRVGRRWVDRQLQAFNMLANQLAWSRRHLLLVDHLKHNRQELERLNWYKHRRLEDIYRTVSTGVQRLLDSDARANGTGGINNITLQSSLKQLQGSLSPLPQIIRKEQWRLRPNYETAPLAGMLKRALERVDSLVKQRQIWSQVHNQANVVVGGDIAKMEMILNELLLFACGRSEVGGRIDLWCRQIDEKLLELSITDYGVVDASLLQELHQGRAIDPLSPSLLDQPPGLHLAICQSLMIEAGGELSLYQLEDNRILSRLILPLSSS